MPFKPVRGEHLVPVVADPAAGPAVPAAACQAHRIGVGRPEERLSRGGAPVEQQPAARAVGEAKPSDVDGLGVVRADDASEAQVKAEAAQDAQPGGQPVDLHVPVHRLLAYAAGCFELGVKAAGQVGDRLLEALRDGREVLLVAADQRRVGLGGEVVGKVKRTGSQRVHVISSDLRSLWERREGHPRATHTSTTTHALRDSHFRRFWPRSAILQHAPGLAASPPVRTYFLRKPTPQRVVPVSGRTPWGPGRKGLAHARHRRALYRQNPQRWVVQGCASKM